MMTAISSQTHHSTTTFQPTTSPRLALWFNGSRNLQSENSVMTFATNKLLKITVLCISVVAMSSSTIAQQSNIDPQTAEERVRRDYTKVAMMQHWHLNDDYVTPLTLLKAASMAREGKDRDDMIVAVTSLRQQYESIQDAGRGEWQVSEDYKAMIRHGGALAGMVLEHYTPTPQIGNIVEIVADVGIMTYENLAHDSKVIEASKVVGAMYHDVANAESHIADLVADTWDKYPVFREVYIEQFAPTMRIVPSASIDDVNRSFPHLLMQDNVAEILDVLESSAYNTDEGLGEVKGQIHTIASELRELQDSNRLHLDKEAESDRVRIGRQRDRIKRNGFRAGAYLASTALGYVDPQLGRQMKAISSATFQFHDALGRFKKASELDLTGAASLDLTATMVKSALILIGAFGETGPSADEIIFNEVRALRKDMQRVRREMHSRFGVVERKLGIIYFRLDEAMESIEKSLMNNTELLHGISAQLQDMEEQISHSTGLLYDRATALEELVKILGIGDCTRWRKGATIPISEDRYAKCVFDLGEMLGRLHTNQLSQDDAEALGWPGVFRKWANEMTTLSVNGLDSLVEEDLPDSISGPVYWETVGTEYLDFLDDWPEHLRIITEDELTERIRILKNDGLALQNVRSIAQGEFRSFQEGKEDNAIGKMLNSIKGQADILSKVAKEHEEKFVGEQFSDIAPSIFSPKSVSSDECMEYGSKLPTEIYKKIPVDYRKPLMRTENWRYCLKLFNGYGLWRASLDHHPTPIAPILVAYGGDVFNLLGRELLFGRTNDRGIFHDQSMIMTNGCGNNNENCPERNPEPSHFTMVLELDYIDQSFKCSVDDKQGKVRILTIYANDEYVYSKRDVIKRWNDDWKDKFSKNSMIKINEDLIKCLNENSVQMKRVWKKQMSQWMAVNMIGVSRDNNEDPIEIADRYIETEYAKLSHWMWLAFGDAAEVDQLLHHFITGTASGPTLSSSVEVSLFDHEAFAWHAPDRFAASVKKLGDVLRSKAIKTSYDRSKDNFNIDRILAQADKVLSERSRNGTTGGLRWPSLLRWPSE